MNLLRVSCKKRCPACGKSDWCLLDPAGQFAVCMRVPSDTKPKSGKGWLHFADETITPTAHTQAIVSKPVSARPSDEHLNDVYSALSEELYLNAHHVQLLNARGLSDIVMHVHGYRSLPKPETARAIADRLSKKYALDGVPGFFLENGVWHLQTYFASGFLIPIRNFKHQITALALRRDDNRKPKYMMISSAGKTNGASSGTPPHFALLGGNFRRTSVTELIVTEGALKANICAYYLQQPVVGLVGVGCFDESFPDLLKEAFPNLEKVKIAFDMDARANDAVLQQRNRLTKVLQTDFIVRVLTWHENYKGLDDFLLYQSTKRGIIAA